MRFNRPDRLAVLLLSAAFLALWGGVLLDRWILQPRSGPVSLDEAGMDSLEAAWSGGAARGAAAGGCDGGGGSAAGASAAGAGGGPAGGAGGACYAVPVRRPETFAFDPNTADSTALLRLGLAPWQVRAVYKYRALGGRYHRPQDFQRLPGMTPEVWRRLAAYVRIGRDYRYYDRGQLRRQPSAPRDSLVASAPRDSFVASAPRDSLSAWPRQEKFAELTLLDLNAADTATLKRVPGIASWRARQIVGYRERLGGFASVEQLGEIDRLPTELQAWFRVEGGPYRKLNLNQASVAELARHPYVGAARARAIAAYRRSQGRLTSLSELGLLPAFSPDVIRRLQPYVEF